MAEPPQPKSREILRASCSQLDEIVHRPCHYGLTASPPLPSEGQFVVPHRDAGAAVNPIPSAFITAIVVFNVGLPCSLGDL